MSSPQQQGHKCRNCSCVQLLCGMLAVLMEAQDDPVGTISCKLQTMRLAAQPQAMQLGAATKSHL